MKIEFFRDRIMGVETPIPPIMIYAAAPDGAPPRRINDCALKKNTELPRRASERPWGGEPSLDHRVLPDFHGLGVNARSYAFPMKIEFFRDRRMGADAPITPIMKLPPPLTGRPRGGSMTALSKKNTEMPRRALQRPWGG